jgi:hypothetical protein
MGIITAPQKIMYQDHVSRSCIKIMYQTRSFVNPLAQRPGAVPIWLVLVVLSVPPRSVYSARLDQTAVPATIARTLS